MTHIKLEEADLTFFTVLVKGKHGLWVVLAEDFPEEHVIARVVEVFVGEDSHGFLWLSGSGGLNRTDEDKLMLFNCV